MAQLLTAAAQVWINLYVYLRCLLACTVILITGIVVLWNK